MVAASRAALLCWLLSRKCSGKTGSRPHYCETVIAAAGNRSHHWNIRSPSRKDKYANALLRLPSSPTLRSLRRMASAKPSALLDTRVIYCGDNLEQLQKLPPACAELITIAPPFNSNRNYEHPRFH